MTYKAGYIPPIIVCPYCEPGTISYAGRVITRICEGCEKLLKKN